MPVPCFCHRVHSMHPARCLLLPPAVSQPGPWHLLPAYNTVRHSNTDVCPDGHFHCNRSRCCTMAPVSVQTVQSQETLPSRSSLYLRAGHWPASLPWQKDMHHSLPAAIPACAVYSVRKVSWLHHTHKSHLCQEIMRLRKNDAIIIPRKQEESYG